jgi:hypothetical protein
MKFDNYKTALRTFFFGVLFIFLGAGINKGLGLAAVGVFVSFSGLTLIFLAMLIAFIAWIKFLRHR